MEKLIFLLISIIILGCSSADTTKPELEELQTHEDSDSAVSLNKFDLCFVEPDSNYTQVAKGCTGGYYKIINNQYVLRISSEIPIENGDCQTISINSPAQAPVTELFIFEKGKANLTNMCTDVIFLNTSEPIKTLKQSYGQITIGKTDSTDFYGYKMTIRVDNLTFIDSQTGQEITLENELFWKVLNTGTPG